MIGKICKISLYGEESEAIVIDIQDREDEMLVSLLWIKNSKLRLGFFPANLKEVSDLKILNKSFKPYFELIFSNNIDHKELDELKEQWK